MTLISLSTSRSLFTHSENDAFRLCIFTSELKLENMLKHYMIFLLLVGMEYKIQVNVPHYFKQQSGVSDTIIYVKNRKQESN